ncbi:MAG: PadR family transcriptional regulator [Eubacterium sp.]|nr:PadR family transcriptional regulator [Eubacterium sp.]
MSLGFGILGLLNYAPMSGYDIVKAFDSSLQFFWHVQKSHIYLELKKLEKEGHICGEMVIQSDRPNKKIFSITETGKKEFMDWLAKGADENIIQFKNVFLMKIFFGGNMSPAQSIEILKKYKADCEGYLKSMGSAPESIEEYGFDMETYQTMYWQFTVDYGYGFIKNCIEWAGRCIQKLESIDEKNPKENK